MSAFTQKEIDDYLAGKVEGTQPHIIKQLQVELAHYKAECERLQKLAREGQANEKQI